MTEPLPSVYLDSTVFISLITPYVPERTAAIRELFTLIEDGSLVGVISAFAIAEVRKFRRGGATVPFDPDAAGRVRTLLTSGRLAIQFLTPEIAFRAAAIGDQFPDLRPGDCVHIATAEFAGVDALLTHDGSVTSGRRRPDRMLGYDGRIGAPPLRIREPVSPIASLFEVV